METILTLIGISWLTNIIAWGFHPMEILKEKYLIEDSILRIGLSCTICLGIWIGLIYTILAGQPLYLIPIISLTSYLFERYLR